MHSTLSTSEIPRSRLIHDDVNIAFILHFSIPASQQNQQKTSTKTQVDLNDPAECPDSR